jgi:hypothetical protein
LNIPPRACGEYPTERNLTDALCFSPYLYRRNFISRIAVGLAFISIKKSAWSPLEVTLVGFALVAISHYADLRYQVFWRNGAIEGITTNNQVTTIKVPDTSNVILETSDLATMLTLRRPVGCITIYSKDSRHLDVSLKHFVMPDIKNQKAYARNSQPQT